MRLLDLPPEILDIIIQNCYAPWSITIEGSESELSDAFSVIKIFGVPSRNLLLTCHELNARAKPTQNRQFTGELHSLERDVQHMGLTLLSFISCVATKHQLDWLRANIQTIVFLRRNTAPSSWSFSRTRLRMSRILELDSLKIIVLDCRYRFHFSVHNVDSARNFLVNEDNLLAREMDFRRSFFFKEERFVKQTVGDGISVRVIRNMGVREQDQKCLAVLVGVDYMAGPSGQLALDWSTLKTTSTVIDGWPNNILKTTESLSLTDVI